MRTFSDDRIINIEKDEEKDKKMQAAALQITQKLPVIVDKSGN